MTESRIIADPRNVEALPEGVNLIHIGPQKTGSTAIQGVMHQRRTQLAKLGVVYPGPSMRPLAAGAEIGFAIPRGKETFPPGAWEDLVAQVSQPGPRRVCVSHEAFGRATPDQVDRIIGELGGEQPHVLAVLRRYDTYLPSQWQQRVKAGEWRSYEQWLRVVLAPDQKAYAWRNVWMPHDTAALVRRWGERVGLDNITLLVGDESDRALLPDVFERLLALPEGSLRGESRNGGNRSLSYPETELLRSTMVYFAEQKLPDELAYRLLHRGMIAALVRSPYPVDEQRIPPLPAWARDRVAELSNARIESLHTAGVRILGDLERLRVAPMTANDDPVPDGVETVSMVTAQRAVEGLIKGAARRPRRPRAVEPTPRPAAAPAPSSLLTRIRRRLTRGGEK